MTAKSSDTVAMDDNLSGNSSPSERTPAQSATPELVTAETSSSAPSPSDQPNVPAAADTQPCDNTTLPIRDSNVEASCAALLPASSPAKSNGDADVQTAAPVEHAVSPGEAMQHSETLEGADATAELSASSTGETSAPVPAPEAKGGAKSGCNAATSVKGKAVDPEQIPVELVDAVPKEVSAEGVDAPPKGKKAKRKKKPVTVPSLGLEKLAVAAPPVAEAAAMAVDTVVKPLAVAVSVKPVESEASAAALEAPRVADDAIVDSAPDTPPAQHRGGASATIVISSGTDGRGFTLYPHEALRKGCTWPDDVDPEHREQHLADEDFAAAMGISRDVFTTMPAWRQLSIKKKAGLF